MPYKTVEVDYDAGDFDDDELIEELEGRGYTIISKTNSLKDVEELYYDWIEKRPCFENKLKRFFSYMLGKNVIL